MGLVDEVTPTARVAGACNAILLRPDGTLLGDQFDGAGFVRGRTQGPQAGRRAGAGVGQRRRGLRDRRLAGGVGVAELMLYDRRDASQSLAGRLREHYPKLVVKTGSNDPEGYDLIVNATPLGMKESDPLPVDIADRSAHLVGEVVMTQEMTPLLQAAKAQGCPFQIGTDMLYEKIPAYLEFFGFGAATPDELRAVSLVED